MNRVTQQTLDICELYRREMEARTPSSRIIADLAARFDVQRPAIWKALRSGGALPPYARQIAGGNGRPRGGGMAEYTEDRRERSIKRTNQEIQALPRVDRDPCPRCGVRGDFGCAHSRTRLGTSF